MAKVSKWLWQMTPTELAYEPFAISYQLTLVTRKPLLEEQLTLALRHLYRKVRLLRTCFGEREGERWLREMEEEIIDFQVVSDVKSDDLHRSLHEYEFNKQTGPLWCVKLRPELNSSSDGVTREKIPEFPHMYSLFFGINHAITDGTSNVLISGFIVQILDEVLTGKGIDDQEQLGVYISSEKTDRIIQEQKALLNSDAELQRKMIEDYKELKAKQSYVKAFLKGEEKVGRSVMLTRDLDAETTASFIKRCRAEGVTVNSAFTAVASLAMVDVLAEEGFQEDTYTIRSDHVPNVRRYWGGDASQYLGCHLLWLTNVVMETPRNIGEYFWNYAKSINTKLHGNIISGIPLLEEATKDLVDKIPDPTFEFEFCVTNMGEITERVAKGGNQVQVVHVVRAAAIHNVPFPIVHFVHTFRGCLVNTLIYNTHFVTLEVAQKYRERIFHHLSRVI